MANYNAHKLTSELLAELERLEGEATAGPWSWDKRASNGAAPILAAPKSWLGSPRQVAKMLFAHGSEDPEVHQNARLVAALRNAAPELLATCRQVEELKAELDREREERAVRARALTSVLQEAEELRALVRRMLDHVNPMDRTGIRAEARRLGCGEEGK